MRNVTTAYHEANKADTRSSDFLIVADTGFGLNKINSASGWSLKSRTGLNSEDFTMWRCNTKTSENVTDYGGIYIGGYSEEKYYLNAGDYKNITFFFEGDCYPTEFDIEFYDCDIDIVNPAVEVIGYKNNSNMLTHSYFSLLVDAGWDTESLKMLKFRFTKWSKQGVKPVILFATYGEPCAVFTKDDLLSVDITLETDPTAQSIPYNSYACSVIDEVDAYNPLLPDSKIYNFTENQKFKFFNFEKGFGENEAITDNLSLFDHEICPVGTAYFRNAKQQGTAVAFDFIDIVEKYDKISLSDEELELSSHFIKRNVKEYLTTLFGADLDTSSIPADLEAITPFYTESKTQILLYMAQLMQKYIYVTTEGVLSFKERGEWSNKPFNIELAQSYQNPVIEKIYENNGVEVNVYGYSMSQNSELVFNRIEFIFDGETLAYYDGSTLYDAETDEPLLEIPNYDFESFHVHYKFNDVYDRNSLFGFFLDAPVYMSELQESTEQNGKKTYKYDDGCTFNVAYGFNYCDTHINITLLLEEKLTASNEHYSDIVNTFAFAYLLMLNELQGCKITSATNHVKRKKYSSNDSNSAVTINNPTITDLETAKSVRDWMYNQIEHCAFSIETDWRGDCSLELGDDATVEVAITNNGSKDYESRFIGTVVKNVIEYNGALKMQTTLYAPTQERWN